MKQFKKQRDYGFFDQDIRLTKLSQLGEPDRADLQAIRAHTVMNPK
jgi:hypothetical protein